MMNPFGIIRDLKGVVMARDPCLCNFHTATMAELATREKQISHCGSKGAPEKLLGAAMILHASLRIGINSMLRTGSFPALEIDGGSATVTACCRHGGDYRKQMPKIRCIRTNPYMLSR